MRVRSLAAARAREGKKLQKHFARFDILFFLICTLVGVDTLGAAASGSPARSGNVR